MCDQNYKEHCVALHGSLVLLSLPRMRCFFLCCLSYREKFEELKAKEKELVAFLDAFPQRKAAKAGELAAKQEAIVAGLERMNKLQALTDAAALPSQGQFQQMKVRGCGSSRLMLMHSILVAQFMSYEVQGLHCSCADALGLVLYH